MKPWVALWFCIVFILLIFRHDIKRKPDVSFALWIPLLWILIISSRAVSLWLNIGRPATIVSNAAEGSPLDRNIFLVLIIIGAVLLIKRKVDWAAVYEENKYILIFFIYLGFSTLWSDYTFVSFKRWIKEIGNLIMVLLIVTEAKPETAFKTVIRRCAFIHIPLSIVFIKYLPYGRAYTPAGYQMYTGVTENKNSLGILCLVCFLVFLWDFLKLRKEGKMSQNKEEVLLNVTFLGMISWLLYRAHSSTALAGTAIGVIIMTIIGARIIKSNIRSIGIYIFFTGVVFLFLQYSLNIIQTIILSMGEDMTLTGRTDIWKDVLAIGINPILGTGYDSFWLGTRTFELNAKWHFNINQSHNGYLETYINLGWIGLLLLIGIIVSSYRSISKTLARDFHYGRIRLAFWSVALVCNVTEAYFKGLSLMWFVFILCAMEPSKMGKK